MLFFLQAGEKKGVNSATACLLKDEDKTPIEAWRADKKQTSLRVQRFIFFLSTLLTSIGLSSFHVREHAIAVFRWVIPQCTIVSLKNLYMLYLPQTCG